MESHLSWLLITNNIKIYNDIQNFKPFNNPEHIHIIGDQAIELQKSKIIIYNLTKIKEHEIKQVKKENLFIGSISLSYKEISTK
jgi:hypothetical protein